MHGMGRETGLIIIASRYVSADPGSARRRCASALAVSGSTSFAAPWSLVLSEPATTWSLPAIKASKPWRATSAASSFSLALTLVWISHEDKIAAAMTECHPFWGHFRRSDVALGGKNDLFRYPG